jgi:CHAD domain-containing protein
MEIGRSELDLPVSEGARVVALRLLDDGASAAARLEEQGDADALHDFRVAVRRLRSWSAAFDDVLGDAIPGKSAKRLKALAQATNPGRDREVQLEWLERVGGTARGERGRAVAWLRDYFGKDERGSRDGLRAEVSEQFPKARDAIVRALSREVATFDSATSAMAAVAAPTLAESIAERKGAHLVALREAAGSIQSLGDEGASHATRIAAKRLRYLIEPARALDGVSELLDALRGLQDALGELHDGHVMAHELRAVTRKCAVADARVAATQALGAELAPARKRDRRFTGVPRAGLVSVMRRLRTDIRAAYSDARRRYDDAAMASLAELADRIRTNLSSGRAVSSVDS